MFLNSSAKIARIAGVLSVSMIASAAACGAGCAGEETFPAEVPVHNARQAWLDRPLERSLREEQSKTRAVLTAYLERRRAETCHPDAVDSRRRADLHTQAKQRVAHAHLRAASRAEKTAMRRQITKSHEIDLSQIKAFTQSTSAPKPDEPSLLAWHCGRAPEDVCLESAAHVALDRVYALKFDDARVSRTATARVLPVVRDDLRWALPRIAHADTPEQAASRIQTRCRQGGSPLAEFVKQLADAEDEQGGAIARGLGGENPCRSIASMYQVLLKMLDSELNNAKPGRTCPPASDLEWHF